jgi:1-deoxy-D-xylulose-5-phosphate synthase
MGGLRPFVAIYSTFLQRAYDQVVHDACQNDQPVVIGVDRAGLVGEDGTSHQGMFTLPAQRQIPNLVVASPKDEQEARRLLRTAFEQDHPFALHYPRDAGYDLPAVDPTPSRSAGECSARARPPRHRLGPSSCARHGRGMLAGEGWSPAVINARYAKPLDRDLILEHARGTSLVVTVEESVVTGGFGSGVLEALAEAGLGRDPAGRPRRIVGRRRSLRRPWLGLRPHAGSSASTSMG